MIIIPSFREEFDIAIEKSMKFGEKIEKFINARLKQNLKIVGLPNIDYSRETSYVDSSTYRYKAILSTSLHGVNHPNWKGNRQVQFYVGRKRYGSSKYYLYAWDTTRDIMGYTHFRFEPALTKTSFEILGVEDLYRSPKKKR